MQKYPWPLVMMTGSMILLLSFLLLWLKNSYGDRLKELKRETNYIYVRSIRDLEDSLMKQTILKLEGKTPNKIELDKAQDHRTARFDSVKIIAVTGSSNIPQGIKMFTRISDDTIHHKIKGQSTISGSISIHVDDSLNGIMAWSPEKIDTAIIKLLKNRFEDIAHKEQFNIPYQILKLSGDGTPPKGLTSTSYMDMNMGEQYAVQLTNFNWPIILKMFPEILFALLLFFLTGWSFYTINNNLRKQRNLHLLKNDFISNMTHELKTPLTTAAIALEAIRYQMNPNTAKKSSEYLDISQKELQRLSVLVDKILNVAHWDERPPEIQKSAFDLKDLIVQVYESLRIQLEKSKAEVSLQLPDDPIIFSGDKVHLFQAIYNLLDNAMKYGGFESKIQITLKKHASVITITFADNGPGIPPKYHHRIFEKFFRVPTGNQHNIKGHGLGLNYVRNIIRSHGGGVTFTSLEPKGTVFTITLPHE